MTHPDTLKRRCRVCGHRRDEHLPGPTTRIRICPDGSGRHFRHPRVKGRASTSFTAPEIRALAEMLSGLRSGKDLRIAARMQRAALTKIERRVQSMAKTVKREQEGNKQ